MGGIHTVRTRVTRFIRTDVWRIPLDELPILRSFLIKQLRIIILTLRGFDQDKCQLRASALTFFSLLSIVPVAAMAFGIAKGFGLEKVLQRELMEKFAGQEEVMARVIDFAHTLLETTKGGMVAGVGLLVLFWAVIKMLMHIERSFNEIWEIKKERSFGRRFSNYFSIMLISPLIVIISGSATVFITTQVTLITERIAFLGFFSPLIFLSLKILPYCLIWILLAFIYVTVPNTKVTLKSGFLAAVVAGTIYQIVQWTYITFQVGIARHNAIYGSFAALPLFLVWLQLSWLIVLFGAEFSFANQNVGTYEFEPDCRRASLSFKRLLALNITHLIIKNFERGGAPFTSDEVSKRLNIPVRLTRQLLYELAGSGILTDTRTDDVKEPAYQPARDINAFSIEYVVEALDRRGTDRIPVEETRELQEIRESLRTFGDTLDASPANRLLKNI